MPSSTAFPFPPALSSLPHSNLTLLPFPVSSPSAFLFRRRSVLAVSAVDSRTSTSDEKKQLFLHMYGLDLAEFDSSPKKQRRRGRRGKGLVQWLHRKSLNPIGRLTGCFRWYCPQKKAAFTKGMDVRPMMEVVRGATFDILQVAGGCPASLRPGCWLDLYSGTGSVGIEAVSRGCSEVHFVEMDPWVVSEVLKPKLEWTGFLDVSVIHMARVENFIQNAEKYLGKDGSFDYISVTPLYTAVDYEVWMKQLSVSPLVGNDTYVITDRRFGYIWSNLVHEEEEIRSLLKLVG